MSVADVDELLAIADRVVGQAATGEQVEAFVVRATPRPRSASTRARSSTSSSAQTRGRRHPGHPRRPHRLRLRRHARRRRGRRGARRGPRQRRRSAPPTSGPGWPSPTASTVAELDLWSDDAGRRSRPTRKIELAMELERLTLAADPRIRRRRRRTTPTSLAEAAVATTTGIRRSGPRERLLRRRQHAGRRRRRDPDRLRVLASAARPTSSTSPRPPREAADRATRLLGATKPPTRAGHRRARPVRHGPASSASSAARSTARRCSRAARCSPTGSARRSPRRSSRWSTTPPTRWPTPRPTSTARAWPPAATSLIDGGVLQQFVHNSYTRPPGRHGVDRQRRARRLQVARPACGCLALSLRARHARRRPS